jgi:hypothetical protein
MDLINCPYCNLHTNAKYKHTSVIVCINCKTPIVKEHKISAPAKITVANKPNESKFDLMGKSFWYNDSLYQITGYIRYFYTEGYLYQWAAYNNKTVIWLCESLGNWFVLSSEKNIENFNVAELRPEHFFSHKGKKYKVDALSTFHNYYMEGELPDFLYHHTKGVSIECSYQDELIQFNIYPDNMIEMYTGKCVDLKDLKVSLS